MARPPYRIHIDNFISRQRPHFAGEGRSGEVAFRIFHGISVAGRDSVPLCAGECTPVSQLDQPSLILRTGPVPLPVKWTCRISHPRCMKRFLRNHNCPTSRTISTISTTTTIKNPISALPPQPEHLTSKNLIPDAEIHSPPDIQKRSCPTSAQNHPFTSLSIHPPYRLYPSLNPPLTDEEQPSRIERKLVESLGRIVVASCRT